MKFKKMLSLSFVLSLGMTLSGDPVLVDHLAVKQVIPSSEVARLLAQYVTDNARNRKSEKVLLVREMDENQFRLFVCLISKRELQYIITDKSLHPIGSGQIGGIDVLFYADGMPHTFTTFGPDRDISWYKFLPPIGPAGKPFQANVEPYISVFCLDGRENKKIGYIVYDPTSPLLPRLPVENKE